MGAHPSKTSSFAASIAAAVTGVSFGLGGTLNQIVIGWGFDIRHVIISQFVIASAILGAVMLIRREKRPPARELLLLLILGLMNSLSTIALLYGINLLTVGQAVTIQFQFVWMAVVIQSVIERKLPGRLVVASVAFVIAGAFLGSGFVGEIVGNGGGLELNLPGVLLSLTCALLYAAFLNFNGKVAKQTPPVTRAFYIGVPGVVAASLLAPGFYAGDCDVIAIAPGGLIMALVFSIIPLICLAVAAKRLKGGTVAILTALELPAAVLSGHLLLGETVTALSLIGVALLCIGVVFPELQGIIARRRC
ncbi:MAG: EamA family transporter [Oscillospiraceae bacterium]|nr:EamA family transporter [Oscillospiraceae bacterium]